MLKPNGHAVLTFSPFTYDPVTGQLYLRGHEVRLPAQNAKLLNVLLRQPGHLVTREELREELWPGVVAVDAEQSINKIVSQLRSALRDDPRLPRYIETFPRRGYRFSAEVGLAHAGSGEAGTGLAVFSGVPDADTGAREVSAAQSPAESLAGLPPELPADLPGNLPIRAVEVPTVWASAVSRHRLRWVLAVVILLATAAALAWHPWSRASADTGRFIMIGIPPMRTTEVASAALAESFRSRLSDRMALLPGIKVRSIHVFSTSPRDDDFMRSLALQPAAGILLLGTLQAHGDRLDVDLEMVREADLSHLASLHYQVTPQELAVLDKRAESDVVSRIKRSEQTIAPHLSLALETYIEGRHLLESRTGPSLRQAASAFEHAIAIDSRFSLGFSGLATANLLLADRGLLPDGYAQARRAARTALEIDSSNAEAHAVLGAIALSADWHASDAEASLRRAIELDPGEATYHLWLASLLNGERRFEEALQQVASARESDPFWPPVYQTQAMIAGNAGRNAEAIAAAQNLTRLTPVWPYAYDQLAWALWYAGKPREAAATWTRMATLGGTPSQVRLAQAGAALLAQAGVHAYALWRLDHRAEMFDSGYHSATLEQAEWQAYSGQQKAVVESIAAMVRSHDPNLIQVGPDPALGAYFPTGAIENLYKSK